MKTKAVKASEITRQWHLVDASDVVLGRLASQVASILKGKHKPIYTPHLDTGDHVIVINADKVRMTGNKFDQKNYYRHTGYPGGLKTTPASKMAQEKPEQIIRLAIKGMLPKNSLGRQMITKLKVYAGSEHPHEAQIPQVMEICG